MLKEYIKRCFNWMNETPEQYAIQGILGEEEEWEYPEWEPMINATKKEIDQMSKSSTKEEVLMDICTVMALDHEREEILDYCKDTLDIDSVIRLSEVAMTCNQFECRWQITELLYSFYNNPKVMMMLNALHMDRHAYVRRRAENVLDRIYENAN